MQLIDIAVASGYAAVSLSLLVLMNPVAPHEAAVEARSQATLDGAISSFIERVGLPFLAASSNGALCGAAAEASNGTLVFDAFVQGEGCGSPVPPSALASSSLTVQLPSRNVVIEAWLARQ
jgi:hypothetical protein